MTSKAWLEAYGALLKVCTGQAEVIEHLLSAEHPNGVSGHTIEGQGSDGSRSGAELGMTDARAEQIAANVHNVNMVREFILKTQGESAAKLHEDLQKRTKEWAEDVAKEGARAAKILEGLRASGQDASSHAAKATEAMDVGKREKIAEERWYGEATIAILRESSAAKDKEIERLQRVVAERDTVILQQSESRRAEIDHKTRVLSNMVAVKEMESKRLTLLIADLRERAKERDAELNRLTTVIAEKDSFLDAKEKSLALYEKDMGAMCEILGADSSESVIDCAKRCMHESDHFRLNHEKLFTEQCDLRAILETGEFEITKDCAKRRMVEHAILLRNHEQQGQAMIQHGQAMIRIRDALGIGSVQDIEDHVSSLVRVSKGKDIKSTRIVQWGPGLLGVETTFASGCKHSQLVEYLPECRTREHLRVENELGAIRQKLGVPPGVSTEGTVDRLIASNAELVRGRELMAAAYDNHVVEVHKIKDALGDLAIADVVAAVKAVVDMRDKLQVTLDSVLADTANDGVIAIASERTKQRKKYRPEHDDCVGSILAAAAAHLATDTTGYYVSSNNHDIHNNSKLFKLPNKYDGNRLKQLQVAGALIAAEYDRVLRERDRAAKTVHG